MNREFVDKMKEAKKLEMEALMTILPENVRGHVEVIQNEMKSMFVECITDCVAGMGRDSKAETADGKVRKIDIN